MSLLFSHPVSRSIVTSGPFFLCDYSSSQRSLLQPRETMQPCCWHTHPPFPSAPAGDVVRLPVHEITSSRATPWKPKCCLVTHSWKYQKHFSICHIGKEHWLLDLQAFCCAWQGHAPLSCIQHYLQARKGTSHLMEGLGEGGGVRHRKYFSRIVCESFRWFS